MRKLFGVLLFVLGLHGAYAQIVHAEDKDKDVGIEIGGYLLELHRLEEHAEALDAEANAIRSMVRSMLTEIAVDATREVQISARVNRLHQKAKEVLNARLNQYFSAESDEDKHLAEKSLSEESLRAAIKDEATELRRSLYSPFSADQLLSLLAGMQDFEMARIEMEKTLVERSGPILKHIKVTNELPREDISDLAQFVRESDLAFTVTLAILEEIIAEQIIEDLTKGEYPTRDPEALSKKLEDIYGFDALLYFELMAFDHRAWRFEEFCGRIRHEVREEVRSSSKLKSGD